MHDLPRYPALYQVDTRRWIREVVESPKPTLADVPDVELDRIASLGVDILWLLSVWDTGRASAEAARASQGLREHARQILPDFRDDDLGASGFAVTAYRVAPSLGGDEALAALRAKLARRGLRLMLDFVPNHTALDHEWVHDQPDRYVLGTERDLETSPESWVRLETRRGPRVFAHGRDPHFSGWTDTVQLDLSNPLTQRALLDALDSIAERCDGVRCDMAMLLEPEIVQRTWGREAPPFWPGAIARIHREHRGFLFLAEAYWDREWSLQQQGFDWCYDKRLLDRLVEGAPEPVWLHLTADIAYQRRLARFLENHDEERAAAVFGPARHRVAALLTYLSPGLRFFQRGQLTGRRLRLPPQLLRAPREPIDGPLARFYTQLLDVLRRPVFREGRWSPVDVANHDAATPSPCLAALWRGPDDALALVAVNLSSHEGSWSLRHPALDARGSARRLVDLFTGEHHPELLGTGRDGAELSLPAHGFLVAEST